MTGSWEEWTRTSMEEQDRLFRRVDADGTYLPHQPIYGFEAYRAFQYGDLVELITQLDTLTFDSVLDVGCAEGFTPRLAQARYGASVMGLDLSVSGVRRMWDYHRIEGACADAHALPFADDAFDVVICTNPLEHTTEPADVIAELARVARRHLFVGVPQALTKRELDEFEPDLGADHDQHVFLFVRDTFQAILPESATITHVNALPTLVAASAYKRTIGKVWQARSLVRANLALDRVWRKAMPKHALYMLARTDFADPSSAGVGNRTHPRRFVTDEIYRRNETELPNRRLHWGLDGTHEFRQYRAKVDEPGDTQPPLTDELVGKLACTSCHASVVAAPDAATLECQGCGDRYEVRTGVPIMHSFYGGAPAKNEGEPQADAGRILDW